MNDALGGMVHRYRTIKAGSFLVEENDTEPVEPVQSSELILYKYYVLNKKCLC